MKAHSFTTSLFACSLMFAATALFGQNSGSPLTENPVFKNNCAKCHGKTGEGRHFGGPSLISDKTSAASYDQLREIISNGKGHMPKYAGKLTPGEISTLVEQIKSANKR